MSLKRRNEQDSADEHLPKSTIGKVLTNTACLKRRMDLSDFESIVEVLDTVTVKVLYSIPHIDRTSTKAAQRSMPSMPLASLEVRR